MSGSTDLPKPDSSRPAKPWMPAALHVWGVYSRESKVWVRNPRTGERERKTRKRFDVRFRVDGHEFRVGFKQKGWSDDFALQLQRDFAEGRLFDPVARRFLPSHAGQRSDPRGGPSFFEFARGYVHSQWHRWEPATRRSAQREFALGCLGLLDERAELTGPERLEAYHHLRTRVFIVTGAETGDLQGGAAWDAWFEKWSLPLVEIDDGHLRAFLESYRTTALDGKPRILSASTVNRTRAVLRGAFTQARKRRLIDWDPWEAVDADPMPDHEQVDPDLVMDPAQVLAIANACGQANPRYRAFVLVQGLCGLRPGEAQELRRRDLALGVNPAIILRGSYSAIGEHYFLEGEGRSRPLKGRGPKAKRTVPLPAPLVPVLVEHVERFVDARRDAVVFTNTAGRRINTSNFRRDVWFPARETVFPEDSPLRNARLHDLRHAAITTWLNAGVPLKTAQQWSGHKTVSVLLDIYLGVMSGDETTARTRFEDALTPNLVTGW